MLCKNYKIKNKITIVLYNAKNKKGIDKENKKASHVIYFLL
jgi:hypothetical protein